MKLEPVYLLAPEPDAPPPRSFSRRVLFLAVAASCGLGSVATLGVQRALLGDDAPLDDADEALIALAERLQDGPVEELVRQRDHFLIALALGTPARKRLESGSRALAGRLLADPPAGRGSSRRDAARALLQALNVDDRDGAVMVLGPDSVAALSALAR
ncbi:MAG: hypothetical protein HZB39_17665 [Planctomycetes bacterium]|nr:hypothetical protein [Planctomycetota bacterium]